mmetsp:Transcript_49852/g.108382  ORF Transcript_49852/g.108382 Transcript_49852/m.108382 type:complete len:202 (+) Transcript_49852:97-702(+)
MHMTELKRASYSTDAIYLICFIHLIICVLVIAFGTPGNDLAVGGVLISPELQWLNSTFNCISIISIIGAGVGTLYLIESHLHFYFAILFLSLLVDLGWFVVFLTYGTSCTTSHGNTDHLTATVSCGLSSGIVIVGICFFVAFKLYALWAVSHAARSVRIKYNDDLLPYLKSSLGQSYNAANSEAQFGSTYGTQSMQPVVTL